MRRPVLGPVLVWPVLAAGGVAGALWAARRWGFGVQRTERERAHVSAGPRLPAAAGGEPGAAPVQEAEAGVGARFHRRYRVAVRHATMTPEALVAFVARDLDAFCPAEIARVEKRTGAPDALAVGDDLFVHIAAPWNGPVRVAEVTPTSFTLATLEGHLEAGLIRFSAAAHDGAPDALWFTIESWARSRDALVDFVYDTLGLAKRAQEALWAFFCLRVAEAAGEPWGEVEVLTERETDGETDDGTDGETDGETDGAA